MTHVQRKRLSDVVVARLAMAARRCPRPVVAVAVVGTRIGFIKALCLKVFTGMVVSASACADPMVNGGVASLMTPETTIGEILAHPALNGYAERLLPRIEDRQRTGLSLRQLDILMPYHSLLNADDMAGGLNFLIRQARQKNPVFLELYDTSETYKEPDKAETGLFFFKGNPGAPFAIIAPGGGFSYVASLHEGLPVAQAIAEQGLNAFVLKYRSGQGQQSATEDLARAISLLFKQHQSLEISTHDYSVWGASAGARMAALIGSYGPAAYGGAVSNRPSCVVMLYTGHSDYVKDEPATFVAVGKSDWISPPEIMGKRVHALKKSGTSVEFQVYSNVPHGFGLGTGSPARGWVDSAIRFWRTQGSS